MEAELTAVNQPTNAEKFRPRELAHSRSAAEVSKGITQLTIIRTPNQLQGLAAFDREHEFAELYKESHIGVITEKEPLALRRISGFEQKGHPPKEPEKGHGNVLK